MTGAMLRLPNAMPCALKAQRVEQILTELVIADPPSAKLQAPLQQLMPLGTTLEHTLPSGTISRKMCIRGNPC
jgi:hypothetical protein